MLDTHVLLWGLLEPDKLSNRARSAMADYNNDLVVSAVSALEISTKFRLGKLPHAQEVALNYMEATRRLGVQHLAILPEHALQAGSFAALHRDPFDRMLAAQSLVEGLPLVTADPALESFPLTIFW